MGYINDENGFKRKGYKKAYNINGKGMFSDTFTGEVYMGSYKDWYKDELHENEPRADFRYYMGRILGVIITPNKKKALFEYLESGRVGNKTIGYKYVKNGDQDIVPMRMLKKEREGGK